MHGAETDSSQASEIKDEPPDVWFLNNSFQYVRCHALICFFFFFSSFGGNTFGREKPSAPSTAALRAETTLAVPEQNAPSLSPLSPGSVHIRPAEPHCLAARIRGRFPSVKRGFRSLSAKVWKLKWEQYLCRALKKPTHCTDYLNEAGNVLENGSIPRMQSPYLRQGRDGNLSLAHRS